MRAAAALPFKVVALLEKQLEVTFSPPGPGPQKYYHLS